MPQASDYTSNNMEHTSLTQKVCPDDDTSTKITGPLYQIAPDTVIAELDTSLPEQMYQVSLEGRHFQINRGSLALLNFLNESRSEAELESFLDSVNKRKSRSHLLRSFLETSL